MLGEEKNSKNLKDIRFTSNSLSFGEDREILSYTKTNKLIAALFMVTDIMDKDEPLRNKLRTLGSEVISDIHVDPIKVALRIDAIMSFLEVSFAIHMISEMNFSILKKEFFKLTESISEYKQIKSNWLEEFLEKDDSLLRTNMPSTRLGTQKVSTLTTGLQGVNFKVSDRSRRTQDTTAQGFDVLKKNRRRDIISVLKMSKEGLTITDIKNKSKGHEDTLSAIASCGEKTLQRELVSMVKDGVLKKEGEKRWSRYSAF